MRATLGQFPQREKARRRSRTLAQAGRVSPRVIKRPILSFDGDEAMVFETVKGCEGIR
jgi:hypothetical protein